MKFSVGQLVYLFGDHEDNKARIGLVVRREKTEYNSENYKVRFYGRFSEKMVEYWLPVAELQEHLTHKLMREFLE